MKKKSLLFTVVFFAAIIGSAQQVTLTPDQIKGYTPDWKGERFPDGVLKFLINY
jgi:hypothetical protein